MPTLSNLLDAPKPRGVKSVGQPVSRSPDSERELLRRLLGLSLAESIEPLLAETLELLVELTGADQGYLELRAEPGLPATSWWRSHGIRGEALKSLRRRLSRSIVDQTLETGLSVASASARHDPRFADRESVRDMDIQAVLCVPVGVPPYGVFYLVGEARGAFTEADLELAELVAHYVGPWARRLVDRATSATDPTLRWRRTLGSVPLVGRSEALAQVLREVVHLRRFDVDVLLTGPTGAGKTHLARILHDTSGRASGPFVPVNCASISPQLFEAEMFGVARGAFDGARTDRRGYMAAAHRGTLFLDEVGELAPAHRAKLLTALESRSFHRVGSSALTEVDVRVVAATNKDLSAADFRVDLFHRLARYVLDLPGLDRRAQDIGPLAQAFAGRFCESQGQRPLEVAPAATAWLTGRTWTGHVRELRNLVEAGTLRALVQDAARVEPWHLQAGHEAPSRVRQPLTYKAATRRFQFELVRDTVARCGGNRAQAARELGLSRQQVYNVLERPPE